jgi:serine/threonine protein kinase
VKTLRRKDEREFINEVNILTRLGGLVDKHLISLLATFTWDEKYHMIFPYAPYDLSTFWEINMGPLESSPPSQDGMLWIETQIVGLTQALDLIHEPKHSDKVRRYGRHGDLKPENILWFKSTRDPLGILVLTDFGLSSFNNQNSRSNIPNDVIAVTPEYRPPECDLLGGLISRSYDIWTLGCLLLEMVAWILGGKEEQRRFRILRTTMNSTIGTASSIFFEVKKNDHGSYVFIVKKEVEDVSLILHSP